MAVPELSVPWRALRRFLASTTAWAVALGAPAAVAAYAYSARLEPVFVAEATLLAPLGSAQLPDGGAPPVAPPLHPTTYAVALPSDALLADAAARLQGGAAAEELREGLRLRWDESRRSYTLVVRAAGPDAATALARANAVAEALVAWDDARARAAGDEVVAALLTQLAVYEEQLSALAAGDRRADEPLLAELALLALRARQEVALARAQAVVARGGLDLLEPAARAAQTAPSPLVNAATAFVLGTVTALGACLVRAGTDRRVHDTSGLAELAGVPVLTDLTRAGARGGDLRFVKAQLDRVVEPGAEVLVAGLDRDAPVRRVAAALERLYAGSESPRLAFAVLNSGGAIERAARASAVVLVAAPLTTDRVRLGQAMAWLRRVRANVVGLVAVRSGGRGARGSVA